MDKAIVFTLDFYSASRVKLVVSQRLIQTTKQKRICIILMVEDLCDRKPLLNSMTTKFSLNTARFLFIDSFMNIFRC